MFITFCWKHEMIPKWNWCQLNAIDVASATKTYYIILPSELSLRFFSTFKLWASGATSFRDAHALRICALTPKLVAFHHNPNISRYCVCAKKTDGKFQDYQLQTTCAPPVISGGILGTRDSAGAQVRTYRGGGSKKTPLKDSVGFWIQWLDWHHLTPLFIYMF